MTKPGNQPFFLSESAQIILNDIGQAQYEIQPTRGNQEKPKADKDAGKILRMTDNAVNALIHQLVGVDITAAFLDLSQSSKRKDGKYAKKRRDPCRIHPLLRREELTGTR